MAAFHVDTVMEADVRNFLSPTRLELLCSIFVFFKTNPFPNLCFDDFLSQRSFGSQYAQRRDMFLFFWDS